MWKAATAAAGTLMTSDYDTLIGLVSEPFSA